MEWYPVGPQLRDVRPERTHSRPSIRRLLQLALQLPHRPLHPSNVRRHVIRRVHVLRLPDASRLRLRLLPRPRDKGYPTRSHGPALLRWLPCSQGSLHRTQAGPASRRGFSTRFPRRSQGEEGLCCRGR
ncbi:hypothetical protein R6Q59_010051 [Mikania micrantha]